MHTHATGFWIGFAFGTIGLFAVALLRLLFPFIETITEPLLLPGRFFSWLFTNGTSVSTPIVILLYLLTGIFYGLCGAIIQDVRRRMHVAELRS